MIRKTEKKDLRRIERLLKTEGGFWDKDWRKDVIKIAINSPSSISYVFERDGKILGFVCAHDLGFRSYLSEIMVFPDERGKGIGKKLLQEVQAELKKRKCKILISDVWKSSIGFYKSLGWNRPNAVLLGKKL